MNILITGGAGFIGSHVVRRFVNAYEDYHIVNMDALTYAGNLANLLDIDKQSNYSFFKGDIVSEADVEEVFQTSCKKVLCGATIPIVPELAKISGAELVMTGVGLAEDGMHAPNESFGLERFEMGFLSIARIVEILSGE